MNYEDVAERMIEAYLGRSLYRAERTELYPALRKVTLRAWPVAEVAAVERAGTWVFPETDVTEGMLVDNERGVITFPALVGALSAAERAAWRPRNDTEADGPMLRITYTAGFEYLPDDIEAAIGLLASALKTAAENGGQQVTYEALDGYQVTYSSRYMDGNNLTMLSPAAAILIEPYRRQALHF